MRLAHPVFGVGKWDPENAQDILSAWLTVSPSSPSWGSSVSYRTGIVGMCIMLSRRRHSISRCANEQKARYRPLRRHEPDASTLTSTSGITMHLAFDRLWTVLKATLAISLLAAGSLFSANVMDQQGLNPFAAALVDPVTTGSLKAGKIE
jgi:hypothetical protein